MLHTIDNDDATSSVETMAFNPSQHWLAAGFNTGTLTLWDVNTCAARSSITTPGAIVKCQWIDEKMLLAACQDGCVRLWDARDQCQLVRQWRGGGSPIFDLSYDAANNCFATACAQGQCRVFEI
jgi:WD40 repeat protein